MKPTRNRRRRTRTLEGLEARQLLAGDLVGHWLAEDLAGTATPDMPVDNWADKTSGIVATLGGGTPTFVPNQIGGRGVIRFDASDGTDYLKVDKAVSPMTGANDYSVIVAFATIGPTVGGNGDWFESTGLVDANGQNFGEGWGVTLNATGQVGAGMEDGFGGVSKSVYSSAGGLADGELHIATVTRSGATLSVSVDGGTEDTITDASEKARGRADIFIGQLLTNRNPYTGDIAEVRFYDGQLTSDEVATISAEIADYYSNGSPVPVDDAYTAEEDQGILLVARPGVLANDTDPEGEALTAVIVETTPNGDLSLLADGSFLYSPSEDFHGVDTFTYRAVDFRESETVGTVNITVTPVNDAPVGVAESFKLTPNDVLVVPGLIGLTANDTDVDNRSGDFTAILHTDVTNGQLTLGADGGFTYDPQGFAGTETFLYQTSDGDAISEPTAVTLIVNTAPETVSDSYTLAEDVVLSPSVADGVLANDIDVDGNTLRAILESPTSNGELVLNDDGTFAYTPNANYHGSDSFSYRVTDGVDESGVVTVDLTVESVNDAPETNEDGFFILPGRTIDVTADLGVLRNDTDVESGSPEVAELVATVSNGNLEFRADGSFVYTPNEGFDGVDQFTYRATDGTDFSDPEQVILTVTDKPVVLSEVMASNASTLETMLRSTADEEFVGQTFTPDWFEVRNLLGQDIDIGGLHVTDDASEPTKWQFPAGTLVPANGYLVVFASGFDINDSSLDLIGSLHTNFSLGTTGDFLGITTFDGVLIDDLGDELPTQRTHITYGLNDDRSATGYFLEPTPGTANGGTALSGLVADTQFDVDRGFFDEPFQLTISTATEEAQIRYTLDGTIPNESSTAYAGPLTIDKTTTIRARAFKDGMVTTNTDTQSYFFLNDVVLQDAQQTLDAGFADDWRGTSPDYGLDDEDQLPYIAGDENMSLEDAREVIKGSLSSLPTLSIVLNTDDLFDRDTGIYSNASRSGKDWERATSVELIHPDGTEGFQIDSGIRIQGGAFRGFGLTKKKSFRFLFKTEYGPGKLEYPLFGSEAATQFDTLTLRMEANDGWQWAGAGNQPVYARDQWHRETQLAMGSPAPHGRNLQVYINGFYWGMYNIVERPDESFAENYLGVENPYNWDGQNSGTATNSDGDTYRRDRGRDVWRDLTRLTGDIRSADTEEERTAFYMQTIGKNPDGTDNPDFPTLVDAVNYSDYLIANYYGGNADWPRKNYYFGRENTPDSEGFKFFLWDAEWSLFLRSNTGRGLVTDPAGVAAPWRGLRESAEFRLLFADRVHKHLFNGGALYVDPDNPDWDPEHPERNLPAKRWTEWTDQIYEGLIAESARWGDQHRSRPYVRHVEWQGENDRIVERWFPERTFSLLEVFRELDLYPPTEAPVFGERGGAFSQPTDVTLSAPAGDIYYTLDGSDPRVIGGAVSPTAIKYDGSFNLAETTTVKARALDGESWSAIDEVEFTIGVVPATADNLRIVEMNYNPARRTDAEIEAGVTDKDEFEYLEFLNLSDQTIDLTDVRLAQTVDGADTVGLDFRFSDGDITRLEPGERVLVVENREAFAVRHAEALVYVAGQWSGGLSNDSETVTVMVGDAVLQEFTYNDEWYPATDGMGSTLEIVDPTADLARWSESVGWRPSAGGSPGTEGGDAGPVIGDSNGDGVFDSSDLVAVFAVGEYEDGIPGNSTFEEGDWDGDGDFTTADLVLAFQDGSYVNGARAERHVFGSNQANDETDRKLSAKRRVDLAFAEYERLFDFVV